MGKLRKVAIVSVVGMGLTGLAVGVLESGFSPANTARFFRASCETQVDVFYSYSTIKEKYTWIKYNLKKPFYEIFSDFSNHPLKNSILREEDKLRRAERGIDFTLWVSREYSSLIECYRERYSEKNPLGQEV